METEFPPLLSNPQLDILYSIRRVFVGQYTIYSTLKREWEMKWYREKVEALDEAIKCFIEIHNVPVEHVEHVLPVEQVRIPGNDQAGL